MLLYMKKLLKNPLFNIFLIVFLTLMVLFFTLRKDGKEIMSMISNANIWMLMFCCGLMIFERVILGWALKKEVNLTQPRYTHYQGFLNAYTAGFFNNITPSSSGGQFAQMYLFRRQGIRGVDAVGVLWLDFIVFQSAMSIFVLLLILLRFFHFYYAYSQFFMIVILGFLVNSAVIVILWLGATQKKVYRFITQSILKIGFRLHIVKDMQKSKAKLDAQLERFEEQLVILKNNKKTIVLVALSDMLRLFIYYAIPYFVAIALHIPAPISIFIDMVALSSFVSMVNTFVLLPGSSGGTEATFILMFSTLFTHVQTTSIMLVWRLVTYYFQTILGALIYIFAKTRKPVTFLKNEDK